MTCVLAATGQAAGKAKGAETADRAGLVLEILFEGNLADTSPRNRRLSSRHGNAEFAWGRNGQCLVFDGKRWIDTGL
ncbi:MAG: hypothetical protein ABIK89_11430, partial [Planctomycetota bacterium]